MHAQKSLETKDMKNDASRETSTTTVVASGAKSRSGLVLRCDLVSLVGVSQVPGVNYTNTTLE